MTPLAPRYALLIFYPPFMLPHSPPGYTLCPSSSRDPRAFSIDEKVRFTLTVSLDSSPSESPERKKGENDMRIWEEQQDWLFYLPWLLETADRHVPKPSCWDLLLRFALSAFTRLLGEERKWFQHMEWFIGPRHAWNRTGKEPRTADKSLRWRDLMRMRRWDAFGRLDKVEGD